MRVVSVPRLGGRSTAECEREVMELWPEKTFFTKMEPSPQLPVLVAFLGLSFPSPLESSMLIYFLWAIIYYLDFSCVLVLFLGRWVGGEVRVRRVGKV